VLWTVLPTQPVVPTPGLRWRGQGERGPPERVTYWIRVTNTSSAPVDFETRYAILAKD